LLHQLVLLKNANLDLVNTVISTISSDDDGTILVLGALARNNNITIQKVVVDELLSRLDMVLTSEAMAILIYALGNTGSKLAIFPLLSTLQYDDIDIQISTIRSLGSHLDEPTVQQAIITFLPLTDEDKILEEILKIMIDAFENMILTNPSKELIDSLINSTIQLENPNLYELLAKYLYHLKIDGVDVYLDLLKQQHNYGDLQHDSVSDMYKNDSRVKRGSDWDENDSDYNVVASYYQRRSDVTKYPNHKAYIWGKSFGVSKMNMEVGAGAFSGLNINLADAGFKFYAKIAAKVNIFGLTINVLDMEVSIGASMKALHYKIYLKQGSTVEIDRGVNILLFSVPKKYTTTISKTREIFSRRWPIFIYVGTLNVDIKGELIAAMKICYCAKVEYPPILGIKGSIVPELSLSLRVTAGTYTSILVN